MVSNGLFSNGSFEKTPEIGPLDSNIHSNDHFGSHLFGNGHSTVLGKKAILGTCSQNSQFSDFYKGKDKLSNVAKWIQSISAIFPWKFSAFYYTSNIRGFSLHVSFTRRAGLMFVRNIGCLKVAEGDLLHNPKK